MFHLHGYQSSIEQQLLHLSLVALVLKDYVAKHAWASRRQCVWASSVLSQPCVVQVETGTCQSPVILMMRHMRTGAGNQKARETERTLIILHQQLCLRILKHASSSKTAVVSACSRAAALAFMLEPH